MTTSAKTLLQQENARIWDLIERGRVEDARKSAEEHRWLDDLKIPPPLRSRLAVLYIEVGEELAADPPRTDAAVAACREVADVLNRWNP